MPLERAELVRGSSPKTGSLAAASVRKTGRRPTSGAGPWVDLAAQTDGKELDAEAGAEEAAYRHGRPPRSTPSRHAARELLLIVDAHRPAHRNDRSNSRQSRSGSPSSSATRWIFDPRSRSTSSYTPGGSQAMCWRTATSRAQRPSTATSTLCTQVFSPMSPPSGRGSARSRSPPPAPAWASDPCATAPRRAGRRPRGSPAASGCRSRWPRLPRRRRRGPARRRRLGAAPPSRGRRAWRAWRRWRSCRSESRSRPATAGAAGRPPAAGRPAAGAPAGARPPRRRAEAISIRPLGVGKRRSANWMTRLGRDRHAAAGGERREVLHEAGARAARWR